MIKQFAATIVGVILLAAGAAMMVLPGPGILVVVAGLAVLATEYIWARSLLDRAKIQAEWAQEAAVASRWRTAGTVLFALAILGLGISMLAAPNVDVPFGSGLSGSILGVTALILLTTTYLTIRAHQGEDTTHTGTTFARLRTTRTHRSDVT